MYSIYSKVYYKLMIDELPDDLRDNVSFYFCFCYCYLYIFLKYKIVNIYLKETQNK